MNPFEPLKYEKPLMALKARITEEGSKAVFSPLIEKYILNNPHRVTVEMQVSILPSVIFMVFIVSYQTLIIFFFCVSLIRKKPLVMKQLKNKFWLKLNQA